MNRVHAWANRLAYYKLRWSGDADLWFHVADFLLFVNAENTMSEPKDAESTDEEAQIFGDEDAADGFEWEEEEPKQADDTQKQAKKKRAARAKTARGPLQKRPFHIMRYNTDIRKYEWLDLWDQKRPPTPGEVRDAYGPGRYEMRDAEKNVERWEIGPDPHASKAPEHGARSAPTSAPPPPRIAPGQLHQGGTPIAPNPYANTHAPAPPAYQQPIHHQGADPQLMSTFYRLDAAIQQISADCRRLQDELRSVTYELQQVPQRVSERVASAIKDSADPFDQMGRVWEMSQKLAEGVGPNEEKGPGMTEMVAAIAGALAPSIGGGQLPQMPPPPQSSAEALPAPENGSAPEHEELAGMTPEIRAELAAHAQARGISYQDAIGLARRQNWDAPTLLMAARTTAKQQAQKEAPAT